MEASQAWLRPPHGGLSSRGGTLHPIDKAHESWLRPPHGGLSSLAEASAWRPLKPGWDAPPHRQSSRELAEASAWRPLKPGWDATPSTCRTLTVATSHRPRCHRPQCHRPQCHPAVASRCAALEATLPGPRRRCCLLMASHLPFRSAFVHAGDEHPHVHYVHLGLATRHLRGSPCAQACLPANIAELLLQP